MTTDNDLPGGNTVPEEKEEAFFTCKMCNEKKPVKDMRLSFRYYPPLAMCRECEKKVG